MAKEQMSKENGKIEWSKYAEKVAMGCFTLAMEDSSEEKCTPADKIITLISTLVNQLFKGRTEVDDLGDAMFLMAYVTADAHTRAELSRMGLHLPVGVDSSHLAGMVQADCQLGSGSPALTVSSEQVMGMQAAAAIDILRTVADKADELDDTTEPEGPLH
jgi:hypothetical protein